jgi:hypothetical protein
VRRRDFITLLGGTPISEVPVTHLWKLKSYATSRDPFGFTQLQLSRLLV